MNAQMYTHTGTHTQMHHPQLSQCSQLIYRVAFENVASYMLTDQGKRRVKDGQASYLTAKNMFKRHL